MEYKAAIADVRVVLVHPKNTSRTCPICGHVAKETGRQGISFVVALVGTLPLPTTWLRKISAGLRSTSRTRQPIRLAASPRFSRWVVDAY
ncbi:zinc ribbon domain-containing protein [Saccharococcus caldoxylosilyticus]|jgi:hypothetical protein|uniref:Cas12f1-like TNB domain-containing protein n=1 Tax=Saccharococcus caldoxylosilyticus TaxID=81408 RepID=A0A150L6S5_9BACL|nr:zinc ribbon domain-containing protein [Parageobacillus caldoxylosilyticus]KYD07696.1 hypothetical protein B4119_3447 [Parageobacillus caldoxylosilyticus]MBB3852280.1 hypothetical protein [Parageobacillus caldoxylosilyticus]